MLRALDGRPLSFALPGETAHTIGKGGLQALGSTRPTRAALRHRYRYRDPALEVERFDATFPSPVGIAAGFDKNAEAIHGIAALGFGSVEIGTITPDPQNGNPRPRLFRLPADRGLINRVGISSQGADRVRERLDANGTPDVPIGLNVGKMHSSDEAEALADYRRVVDRLSPYADYVVVNVSCPNTAEEFDQQSPAHLRGIFETLEAEDDETTPVLVKVDPDTSEDALREVVDVGEECGLDGIIATNTASERPDLASPRRYEWGGLSGKPIEDRSTGVVRTLAEYTDLPIIGVGGVDSAISAYAKIRAGASLVQLYTGLVYEGPALSRQINRGLVTLLERDGFESVEDAVGADLE
ncbi:quinone-dependent dihydroorotate dehydrogenase [Halosimplex salinum]|uniref:quinone-dependent dihydroorotate dehydrogenase n=1 Tax=Halosimplex salinum TaxID=1710538 RepID=UPI000F4640D8|nr:quinone-dependent dihydroorotate dehydrogenase [Halosimplex salinum]